MARASAAPRNKRSVSRAQVTIPTAARFSHSLPISPITIGVHVSRKKTTLNLALGSAIAATLGIPSASAGENPFVSQPLAKGYMIAAAEADKPAAKATESKCGGMKKKMDGKCGMKKREGKCGGMKRKMKDGSCGDMKSDGGAKKPEAKAKDASCGASMNSGDGKAKDASCGASMKMDDKK